MSSLGKKYCMAVTGVLLMLFVIAHLAGNLQIFIGAEWLNAYAEHLEELPLLLWSSRVILSLALLVHMGTGLWLAVDNRRARPVRYASQRAVEVGVAPRAMVFLGLAIFCFIIFHLLHFTFGTVDPRISEFVDPKGRHDVYSMVVLGFRDPTVVLAYLAAMFFLAAHLSHGAWSFLQSLGFLKERAVPKAKIAARVFAVLIFLGYSSIAVASYAGWLKPLQGGPALGS